MPNNRFVTRHQQQRLMYERPLSNRDVVHSEQWAVQINTIHLDIGNIEQIDHALMYNQSVILICSKCINSCHVQHQIDDLSQTQRTISHEKNCTHWRTSYTINLGHWGSENFYCNQYGTSFKLAVTPGQVANQHKNVFRNQRCSSTEESWDFLDRQNILTETKTKTTYDKYYKQTAINVG